MEYMWDDWKRLRNIVKHGVDFASMSAFDWETATGFQDDRQEYGEARWLFYGKIGNRLHACVFTQRDGVKRIISLRKANKREETQYEKATQTAD